MTKDAVYATCAADILATVDTSYDGVVTYDNLLRSSNNANPLLLQNTLVAMIAEKILCKRDCYAYAVERIENVKSHYGLQRNFNMTVHLTRSDYTKWLNDNANGVGVRLLIFDDAQRCVNVVCVPDEIAGDEYYQKWYDTKRYSHSYVMTRSL